MEENKCICPECDSEMMAVYEKPALNLTCPKCGCKIATTKWEDIDLDDATYRIFLKPNRSPNTESIKIISKITGLNFIDSKQLLENGGLLFEEKAVEIKRQKTNLDLNNIKYTIEPTFPY